MTSPVIDLEQTAVDRFVREHELLSSPARTYRDLLPMVGPGTGEQYAFEVDLDACSGCKACVSACHSLNGLDEGETWRSVGLLVGAAESVPLLQTVTTACHHCVEPACLSGCPVDAYEKDPITGIVFHLDDQCIGCNYCTLMCPYEVPVYDHDRGIVRKCDLCRDRLAEGEAPACVQGCPTSAISIAVVDIATTVAEARDPAAGELRLVPGAAPSSVTIPTTRYVSREPRPDSLVAADQHSLQPAHAHTPLAVMLVLTQLSVGAFVLSLAFGDRLVGGPVLERGLALAVGVLALGASVLHLGRPQLAWRAFIGFGHSWLSREIVAFGAFAGLATLDAVAVWRDAPAVVRDSLDTAVAVAGLAGVACSALIYAATRRRWWRFARTGPLFALGGTITGAALLLLVGALAGADGSALRALAAVTLVASAVQLAGELPVLTHRFDERLDARREQLHRTARLLAGDLRRLFVLRMAAGAIGGLLLPLIVLSGSSRSAITAVALLGLVVLGELSSRRLFFLAVSAPSMPGVIR